MKPHKYRVETLIPALRKAAKFRNDLVSDGYPDNGGAIHSAERILNILSERIKYPSLTHLNKIRFHQSAEFSHAAAKIYEKNKKSSKISIEHVSPIRDFTQMVIKKISEGATDKQLKNYILRNYRLVMLTKDETKKLNKQNRSKMAANRLIDAGISVVFPNCKTTKTKFN